MQEDDEEQQSEDLTKYLENINNQNAENKECIQQMAAQTKDEVKQLKEQLQARDAQIDKLMECMNKILAATDGK